ncbi:hypothetical protein JCM10295v2_006226 [Rhodotorula toruloides]
MPFLNFDAPDTTPPRTFSHLEALLRTLEARDDLARSVQKLDLGRWTARCSSEAKVDRRQISSLAVKLVVTCPALKVLSLPFVVQADKKDLVVALKQLVQFERLTIDEAVATADPWIINIDASIKEEWGKAIWTIADLAAFAPSWPRIKALQMYATARSGQEDDIVVDWQLEEFSLLLGQNAKLDFHYLHRLLHGSRRSLRCLNVREHQLEPGVLAHFLEDYGGNIRILRTFTSDHFSIDKPLLRTIATRCPNLRELQLDTPIPDLEDALSQLAQLRYLHVLLLGTVFAINLNRLGIADTIRSFRSLKYLGISPGFHEHPNDRFGQFFDDFCIAIDDIRGAVEESGMKVWELPSWDGRAGFRPIRWVPNTLSDPL